MNKNYLWNIQEEVQDLLVKMDLGELVKVIASLGLKTARLSVRFAVVDISDYIYCISEKELSREEIREAFKKYISSL